MSAPLFKSREGAFPFLNDFKYQGDNILSVKAVFLCKIDLYTGELIIEDNNAIDARSSSNYQRIKCMNFRQTFICRHDFSQSSQMGVVGCGEGVVYLTSPRRPTDIGLQLAKVC